VLLRRRRAIETQVYYIQLSAFVTDTFAENGQDKQYM
jgi:hypothetical protein